MTLIRKLPQRLVDLWPWVSLSLALTTLPYLWIAYTTPAEHQFLGALINPTDLSVYLAAIRQGAGGAWLFEVTFTPELITPKITYPFYLALGRLANFAPIDVLWLYHGSRLLAGLLLFGLVAVWLDFLEIAPAATDAFILIFLSGGWGWLFLATGWVLPDVHVAEWLPFLSIFHAPHFALGMAAEIMVMTALLMAYRQQTKGYMGVAILAAVGALALSLLYPYRIVPMGVAIVLYALIEVGRTRQNWRQKMLLLHTSFWPLLILGVMGLYYAIVARADPFWEATHVVQNNIPSPNLLEAFLAWGGIGVLALLVGYALGAKGWASLPEGIRLCLVWFGAGVLCLYLPVSFQGRFALNIYLPLAVIAAWGLHHELLPRLAQQPTSKDGSLAPFAQLNRYRRGILVLGFTAVLMSIAMMMFRPSQLPEQYFIANSEVRAAEWLVEHAQKDDLVLVGPRVGNYLPRYFDGRVFVGQFYITVNSDDKVKLVRQFFEPETTDEWREDFLEEWDVDYIYYGYDEAEVGAPPELPHWEIVYIADGITIYSQK
jgi:hypothetical protein